MHGLICGQTMSGKTTLARQIARQHAAAGRGVLVLDPLYDQELQQIADWSTDDPDEFLAVVFRNQNCTLIIDEGGQTIGRYAAHLERLATQSRHLGHIAVFISQRPMQISKTIRAQCGWLACFQVCAADAAGLSDDFNQPLLLQAPALHKGQYYMIRRFADPAAGHIFGGSPPALGGRSRETLPARSARPGRAAAPVSADLQPARRRPQKPHRPRRQS